MEMMNIIGYLEELDKVSMEIVRGGCVHVVSAHTEINQNDFTVITPEHNTSILMDLCFIKPFSRFKDFTGINEKLDELMSIFDLGKTIKKRYVEGSFDYEDIVKKTDYVYNEVMKYHKKLESEIEELQKIKEFQGYMKRIKDVKTDFEKLKNMNFFNFRIGKLSRENYEKLMDNIENISSIIYEISSPPGSQIIISFTPKVLEIEVDRVFKSLNYETLDIPYNISGTPAEIIKELEEKVNEKNESIVKLKDEVAKLRGKYIAFVDESFSRIRMLEKTQVVNSEVVCTNDFFYMAGWVPVSEKKNLQNRLSDFGDRLVVVFKPQSEINTALVPPTKLKNNWFTRPFEALVRMYGIPSYDELDPTSFVAISYMIMFGSMFGDIGQGAIFLIAGLLLSLKWNRPNFGGILSRIGISSMIFGAMFGSVFGSEEIFKPLLFHPMHNINAVLIGGVVVGIGFTTIAFIFSLINSYKRRDIEEGVFGKDGLVGLMFYWIILFTAFDLYKKGETTIPFEGIIAILSVLLIFMMLKEPIANFIKGNRPLYHESVQDYYIESGFGVLETLLSMFSNTVSFIRVGAFALNHVGLFIAFTTIGHLMKSGTGSVAMMIIGNIVVIGLEGLVVFIQGLRLEYYELFSKYYHGDGSEFDPVRIMYTSRANEISTVSSVNIEEIQSLNI